MEVATDKFLRDLDAATQTSTTLPSKNVAVGDSSSPVPCGYLAKSGSTFNPTGRGPGGDGEIHSVLPQGAAIPVRDKESNWGTFLQDYGPSRQSA